MVLVHFIFKLFAKHMLKLEEKLEILRTMVIVTIGIVEVS